ncbi:hypothetical protein TNCV_2042811 [Trichonephila clavipes]|nr:hypothetical protein TNCV_2042811 [Trichonephila clavipes]
MQQFKTGLSNSRVKRICKQGGGLVPFGTVDEVRTGTATAGSDVVQSGRPIFDDFSNICGRISDNTANVVFQMVKRLWLIRIDQ